MDRPTTPPRAYLVAVIRGPGLGRNLFIHEGELATVGRHVNNGLNIPDDEISGRHCSLSYTARGLLLQDLASSNGTLVGERPIQGVTPLRSGQTFQLGASVLKVFAAAPDLPRLSWGRFIRILGEGSVGRVFEVEAADPSRRVALKVMHADLSVKDRARCRREARLQSLLDHPGIPRSEGLIEQEGRLMLVSELVVGESLEAALAAHGPRPWPEALRLILAAASALAYAHAQGVIHRDIKPGNMILESATQRLKLIDFGFAKDLTTQAHSVAVTSLGSHLGTYDYMAAEALRDSTSSDARADLFSLAASLYELGTGRMPFPAQTLTRMLELRRAPPPATGGPAALDHILCQALSYEPTQRPASVAAFAQALAALAPMGPERLGDRPA